MLDKLKSDFDAIIELVNKAPQSLQEMAFKMIMEHWFASNLAPRSPSTSDDSTGTGGGSPSGSGAPDAVKPFLTANAITTELLGKVFHPTGPGAQILVSDMPGTGKAGKMISLSILLCVRHALDSGSFTCTLKELRELSVHYDCYDSTNFATYLKTNKNYYKPREKGADLELSGPGLKKAADVIKSIATGA